MSRSLKLATVCVISVLALSLSAYANSNDSFQNAALTGVSGGGDVSGTFDFNSNTHQFSGISISFVSSVFGNVSASDFGSINGIYNSVKGTWSFQWQTIKGWDLITYDVVYNPNTNQFTASGSIQNLWNQGSFNYMQVPEGGNSLAYLLLSGMALFIAIFLSRKQRRPLRAAQSI
jgi:hypothetical protein